MGEVIKPLDEIHLKEKIIFIAAGLDVHGELLTYQNEMFELFRLQKYAHANMVMGNLKQHTEQCKSYKITLPDKDFCLCEARSQNKLIGEQRGRNIV